MPAYLIPVFIILIFIPTIFIPMGRFLLRGRSNSKLRTTGTRAQAQILQVQRTGIELNRQPQMQITALVITGQESFQVVMKELIPIAQLHQFSPGQTINIVYERSAKGVKATLDTAGGADDIIQRSQELLVRLNASGVPARAFVTQFTPTGVVVNGDNILVKLSVAIQTPGGVIPSSIHGVFGSSGLHKYQPGQEIAVRYDAHDPQTCTIDIGQMSSRQVNQPSAQA